MTGPAAVRVEGLSKLIRQLTALGLDVEDMKDVMSGIAADAANLARGFAPKESGALAASIRPNRAKGKAVVSAGKNAVPYAGVINYGWPARGITGTGFMQKASDAIAPRAAGDLERGIAKLIQMKGLG